MAAADSTVAGTGGGEGDSGLVSGAGEADGGCSGGGGSVGLVAIICSFLIRQWFFYFRIALAELIYGPRCRVRLCLDGKQFTVRL